MTSLIPLLNDSGIVVCGTIPCMPSKPEAGDI